MIIFAPDHCTLPRKLHSAKEIFEYLNQKESFKSFRTVVTASDFEHAFQSIDIRKILTSIPEYKNKIGWDRSVISS